MGFDNFTTYSKWLLHKTFCSCHRTVDPPTFYCVFSKFNFCGAKPRFEPPTLPICRVSSRRRSSFAAGYLLMCIAPRKAYRSPITARPRDQEINDLKQRQAVTAAPHLAPLPRSVVSRFQHVPKNSREQQAENGPMSC